MTQTILVVEDDLYIQELIAEFLKAQSYRVEVAENGQEAWDKLQHQSFDLVILDIMMPKLDGFSLCKMIRNNWSTPVIIVSALSEEKDQLKAFELEADDYITKPFSFNILVKRVEAVLRRSQLESEKQTQLSFDSLRLDCNSFKAFLDDKPIELTVKEFEILQCLLENPHKVLTRDILLEKVWGYDFFGDPRIVDAHIKNIRKKIGQSYIKTVKGIGYTMERGKDEA